MTTHITLTTFVVFFAVAAFGALVFALAHVASHGGISPPVEDDAAPEEDNADDKSVVVQLDTEDQDRADAL